MPQNCNKIFKNPYNWHWLVTGGGQILVTDDMLGLSGFYPKFVKKYANLNSLIERAVKNMVKKLLVKNFQILKIIYMENENLKSTFKAKY